MQADLRQTVSDHLVEYLRGTDPREALFRELAATHRALPIFPDWGGFVGLREDGSLVEVSEDSTVAVPDKWACHIALIRAGELFPALAFLSPKPQPDWIPCDSCGGTGQLTIDGAPVPEGVRCRCAGLGRLPPDVARFLRACDDSRLTKR